MSRSACVLTGLTLLLFASGCGKSTFEATSDHSDDDTALAELLSGLDQPVGEESVMSDPAAPVIPVATAEQGQRLELRLNQGDRFPLIKTIEQQLIQKSQTVPVTAQTRLELTMAIEVQEVRDDAILMSVRYSRVSYAHDVNGQRLSFDSGVHQGAVPHDVIPYAGMVNNGFSFWLGKDNRIKELVGYDEFLERCVANVPAERRQSLLAEISTRFGDDGVANFVDDSIGMLPYDDRVDAGSATRVIPGDVWTRERRLMQPIPVYMTSTYRLLSLGAQTAQIDITGRIASGETFEDARSGVQSDRIRITGGHSLGTCTVDRATGLPLNLERTRRLNMQVTTASGQSAEQEKTIVTTIRAFPQSRGPVVQNTSGQTGPIRRVGGTDSPGQLRSAVPYPSDAAPVTPPAGQAVQAVY